MINPFRQTIRNVMVKEIAHVKASVIVNRGRPKAIADDRTIMRGADEGKWVFELPGRRLLLIIPIEMLRHFEIQHPIGIPTEQVRRAQFILVEHRNRKVTLTILAGTHLISSPITFRAVVNTERPGPA